MMIRLLLDDPSLRQNVSAADPHALSVMIPGMINVIELYQFCLSKPQANTAQVLEIFVIIHKVAQLAKLMMWEYAEQNQVRV